MEDHMTSYLDEAFHITPRESNDYSDTIIHFLDREKFSAHKLEHDEHNLYIRVFFTYGMDLQLSIIVYPDVIEAIANKYNYEKGDASVVNQDVQPFIKGNFISFQSAYSKILENMQDCS